MVEHGMLDAMVAGFAAARYRVELYVGQGNSFYLLIGLVALLVLFLGRRRRFFFSASTPPSVAGWTAGTTGSGEASFARGFRPTACRVPRPDRSFPAGAASLGRCLVRT